MSPPRIKDRSPSPRFDSKRSSRSTSPRTRDRSMSPSRNFDSPRNKHREEWLAPRSRRRSPIYPSISPVRPRLLRAQPSSTSDDVPPRVSWEYERPKRLNENADKTDEPSHGSFNNYGKSNRLGDVGVGDDDEEEEEEEEEGEILEDNEMEEDMQNDIDEEPMAELEPPKPTSEAYLEEMNKKDPEIATWQRKLNLIKDKIVWYQSDLQNAGENGDIMTDDSDDEDETLPISKSKKAEDEAMRTLVQKIYAENQAKAKLVHLETYDAADAEASAPQHAVDPNLFPSVVKVKEDFVKFLPILQKHLYRTRAADAKRVHVLANEYDDLRKAWVSKVSQGENNATPLTRAIKNERNQFFETIFPHAIRYCPPSPDAYQFSANSEPSQYNSQVAIIPPQLIGNAKLADVDYINRNGLIEDSMKLHMELENLNVWTQQEQDIFVNRFIAAPKKFAKIASFLPNKTTADCIRFYYRSKKQLKFKEKQKEEDRRSKRKASTDSQLRAEAVMTLLREEAQTVNISWSFYERAQFQKLLMVYGSDLSKFTLLLPSKSLTEIEAYFEQNQSRFEGYLKINSESDNASTLPNALSNQSSYAMLVEGFEIAPVEPLDQIESGALDNDSNQEGQIASSGMGVAPEINDQDAQDSNEVLQHNSDQISSNLPEAPMHVISIEPPQESCAVEENFPLESQAISHPNLVTQDADVAESPIADVTSSISIEQPSAEIQSLEIKPQMEESLGDNAETVTVQLELAADTPVCEDVLNQDRVTAVIESGSLPVENDAPQELKVDNPAPDEVAASATLQDTVEHFIINNDCDNSEPEITESLLL